MFTQNCRCKRAVQFFNLKRWRYLYAMPLHPKGYHISPYLTPGASEGPWEDYFSKQITNMRTEQTPHREIFNAVDFTFSCCKMLMSSSHII